MRAIKMIYEAFLKFCVFSLLTAWAGCLALGVEPGMPALLFLIVLTSSGQAVPSSPGYVGVYHYLATLETLCETNPELPFLGDLRAELARLVRDRQAA